MSSLSVTPAASYYPAFQSRGVNPKTDKVYVDPQTGELTTWQPGLKNPQAEEKSNTRKKAFITTLVLAAGAAAIWFFTKGKGKPYLDKLMTKAKPYVDKAVDFFKKGWDKVKSFFGKGSKTTAPKPSTAPAAGTSAASAVAANDVEHRL